MVLGVDVKVEVGRTGNSRAVSIRCQVPVRLHEQWWLELEMVLAQVVQMSQYLRTAVVTLVPPQSLIPTPSSGEVKPGSFPEGHSLW